MRNLLRIILVVLLVPSWVGCDFISKRPETGVVARVNNTYLYQDDISSLVPSNASATDSSQIVNSFINRWATRQLLVDRAKLNLSTERQNELQELVRIYENELYSTAYTDEIISRELDTVIPYQKLVQYYQEKGENFVLNEDLVKLRYVSLSPQNSDYDKIKDHLQRFDQEDRKALLDMALQFKSYSLNDSVWVKTREVYERVQPLTPQNNEELLKKNNFFEIRDSLGVYLVAVEDVKLRTEQAPLEYSLPTIQQILLNRQKLELIRKLEKDITQDAIKNQEFEIY